LAPLAPSSPLARWLLLSLLPCSLAQSATTLSCLAALSLCCPFRAPCASESRHGAQRREKGREAREAREAGAWRGREGSILSRGQPRLRVLEPVLGAALLLLLRLALFLPRAQLALLGSLGLQTHKHTNTLHRATRKHIAHHPTPKPRAPHSTTLPAAVSAAGSLRPTSCAVRAQWWGRRQDAEANTNTYAAQAQDLGQRVNASERQVKIPSVRPALAVLTRLPPCSQGTASSVWGQQGGRVGAGAWHALVLKQVSRHCRCRHLVDLARCARARTHTHSRTRWRGEKKKLCVRPPARAIRAQHLPHSIQPHARSRTHGRVAGLATDEALQVGHFRLLATRTSVGPTIVGARDAALWRAARLCASAAVLVVILLAAHARLAQTPFRAEGQAVGRVTAGREHARGGAPRSPQQSAFSGLWADTDTGPAATGGRAARAGATGSQLGARRAHTPRHGPGRAHAGRRRAAVWRTCSRRNPRLRPRRTPLRPRLRTRCSRRRRRRRRP